MKPQITYRFMDPILYSSIRDTLTGETFFWFYNDFVNYGPSEGYKFTNQIVKNSNLVSNLYLNY